MPMRLGSPLPPLEGATGTYNTDGISREELTGGPLLVHFWSVSCHICHEVMHEIVAYRDQYREQGLKVIGVHMPKQPTDLDVQKVEQEITAYGLTHPMLVDNQHKVTDSFLNQFVPAFFLFNGEGTLFFRAAGDKGLQNLRPKLEQLFGVTVS